MLCRTEKSVSRAADMLLQRWNEKDYGEHRNGQKGMDVSERR